MIFVPLLHYFLCKNDYSGNEAGLRYRLTPPCAAGRYSRLQTKGVPPPRSI